MITRNPTARAMLRAMFAMRHGLGHGAGFRTPVDLMLDQAIWAARKAEREVNNRAKAESYDIVGYPLAPSSTCRDATLKITTMMDFYGNPTNAIGRMNGLTDDAEWWSRVE